MPELVIALDYDDALEALNMATCLRGHVNWVKVGLELFVSEGPRILHSLRGVGYKVFLDLKLHDIPNTVHGATLACITAGANLLTVHLSGGQRMCQAAVDAIASSANKPLLYGVTVLTSLGDGELPFSKAPLVHVALELADLAKSWGLDGVVCSGLDVGAIKQRNSGLGCLVPGIRLGGERQDDQRRVSSPGQAVADGADFLVVGRPVTRAADPIAAVASIVADISSAK